MRLNWFSPLPPAKTEIANHTARLLPALREQAEVTLWTDQAEWDPALERIAQVCGYEPNYLPWAELNRADATFYNIGNNAEFHLAIWQVSQQYPGIVVLHDVRLQDFFAYLYRWIRGDRDGYCTLMERCYGAVGRLDAERWWYDEVSMPYMVEHYPLTPMALHNATGALVHTREAFQSVTQQTWGPVGYAPLPYPATPRSAPDRSRGTEVRSSGPPYRLAVFGYIHRNRRLGSLLSALKDLPERKHFRLDIYGELWDPDLIRGQIHTLGLADTVSIHGFVPEPELDAALSAAHLAVNLRYPTMGEASASQLRIWNHALPTLVTKVGMYASLPADAVAFVRVEEEVPDIQAHLRALLADPGRFAAMGEAGRHLLEERHAPETYAGAVRELVERARAARRHAVAHDLASRVGSELGGWITQPAAEDLFIGVAHHIHQVFARAGDSRGRLTTDGPSR